jgi:hypothetical protein
MTRTTAHTTAGTRHQQQHLATSIATVVLLGLITTTTTTHAFVVVPPRGSITRLHMGLFDGVKEAFSAPALERSTLDPARETPIDRWMGWSVVSSEKSSTNGQQPSQKGGTYVCMRVFVDVLESCIHRWGCRRYMRLLSNTHTHTHTLVFPFRLGRFF